MNKQVVNEQNLKMDIVEGQDRLKLEKRADGQFWVVKDGQATRVRVQSCFPWSGPLDYISLRDDDDNEVALISFFDKLDAETRNMILEALAETGFLMRITEIHSITNDFEIRNWKVRTLQGKRTFQTELGEWPRVMPNGGLLIKDVAGDLYLIPEPGKLDKKSRKLIWAYLD